ncbi:hypothetical protein CC79DRAFT_1330096 [Sarocladium strictum]
MTLSPRLRTYVRTSGVVYIWATLYFTPVGAGVEHFLSTTDRRVGVVCVKVSGLAGRKEYAIDSINCCGLHGWSVSATHEGDTPCLDE